MTSCCLFCKLFVQPATNVQEIVLKLYFDYSHCEIQTMNSICSDAYNLQQKGGLLLHDDVEKDFLCLCNLETFLVINIVIIDIFVYVSGHFIP